MPNSLPNGLLLRPTEARDAAQLEDLQRTVFPTLADDQRLKAKHYLKHIEIFPEGQFVVVDADRVVGMTTSIRLSSTYLGQEHTFAEVIQGGFCTSHDPRGDWLYGVDMGTHPDYRGQGIARALYAARQETVKKLGLKGQYTMGMLSGYGPVSNKYSIDEYYAQMLSGGISDPTLAAQMKVGFEPRGLVRNYLDDPGCGNACVRLVLDAHKIVS